MDEFGDGEEDDRAIMRLKIDDRVSTRRRPPRRKPSVVEPIGAAATAEIGIGYDVARFIDG